MYVCDSSPISGIGVGIGISYSLRRGALPSPPPMPCPPPTTHTWLCHPLSSPPKCIARTFLWFTHNSKEKTGTTKATKKKQKNNTNLGFSKTVSLGTNELQRSKMANNNNQAPWIETGFTVNHAPGDDKDVEAILELYMNAQDAHKDFEKRNNTTPRSMPEIKVINGVITITNKALHKINRTMFWVGRANDVEDDPDKMGRYSLGLKDAIAVLHRKNKRLKITAHGQQVIFRADDDGLMLYQISGPVTENRDWCVEIFRVENPETKIENVKSHFVQFVNPPLLHESKTQNGDQIRIYEPTTKGENAWFRGPQGKNCMCIGERFVEQAGINTLGYHIVNPTKEIKSLIDRNQKLPNLRGCKLIWDMLCDIFENDEELKTKVREMLPQMLPHGCREIRYLLPGEFQEQAGSSAGGGGGGGEKKGASKIAPGAPLQFCLDVDAAKNAVQQVRESIQPKLRDYYDLLCDLEKIARHEFRFASVIPYGSMIYQVGTVRAQRQHLLLALCAASCLLDFPANGIS